MHIWNNYYYLQHLETKILIAVRQKIIEKKSAKNRQKIANDDTDTSKCYRCRLSPMPIPYKNADSCRFRCRLIGTSLLVIARTSRVAQHCKLTMLLSFHKYIFSIRAFLRQLFYYIYRGYSGSFKYGYKILNFKATNLLTTNKNFPANVAAT